MRVNALSESSCLYLISYSWGQAHVGDTSVITDLKGCQSLRCGRFVLTDFLTLLLQTLLTSESKRTTRNFLFFPCTSMSLCSHRIPFFWSVGSRISSFSHRLLRGRALPRSVLFPRHYSLVGLHSSSAIDCAAFWSTTLSDPVCISSSFSARPHALCLP